VGNGQDAAGLRVFLAGVASAVAFAALAAALLTDFFAGVPAFLLDLLAVDGSVTEESLLVEAAEALLAGSSERLLALAVERLLMVWVPASTEAFAGATALVFVAAAD